MFCCPAGAETYPDPCPWHGEFSEMTELPQQSVIVPADDYAAAALAIANMSAGTLSLDYEPWWQVGLAAAWQSSILVAYNRELG